MRRRSASSVLAVLAILGLGWLSVGCGGSGGGGGPTSPPPPTLPPSGVTFTPDASASANSVSLSSGGGSGSVFVLDVDVRDVTDLYGVSFVLEYPQNQLSFRKNSESEGTFLSSDGVDTELQVTERNKGEIVVGISRLGEVPGADGSGTLLSLEFNKGSAGSGPVEMTEHNAVDSFGVVQGDVTWIGGTVRVN